MRIAVIALPVIVALVGLAEAQTNPGDWRSYGLNSLGWRYSELTQIDTRNVSRLSPAWIYQSSRAASTRHLWFLMD